MGLTPFAFGPRLEHELRWKVHEATSPADRRRFLDFPWQLYRGDRYWTPPFYTERFNILPPPGDPSFVHLEMGLFIAETVNRLGTEDVAGTIAVLIDRRYNATHRTALGFFGLFEVVNEPEIAEGLFEAAENWLRRRLPEAKAMRGPVRLGALDGCGVLADGFDSAPAVFMPYNPPYYDELIQTAGYAPAATLLAYSQPLSRPAQSTESSRRSAYAGDPVPEGLQPARTGDDRGLVLRPAGPAHLEADLEQLARLYNAALGGRPGFMAMADAGLKRLAQALAGFIDPDLLLFLEHDNQPVGFSLAMPDLNAARRAAMRLPFPLAELRYWLARRKIHRVRLFPPALLPAYRDPALLSWLLGNSMAAAARLGYRVADYACLPASDDLLVAAVHDLGAHYARTYSLYEKAF